MKEREGLDEGHHSPFPDDSIQEFDDDLERQPRVPPVFKIVAVVVCLAFLTLALNSLFSISFSLPEFVRQSQTLSQDPFIKDLRRAVVQLRADGTGDLERVGTGFNISPEGFIITNRHLVEGADVISVAFHEDGRYLATNWFEASRMDLAVILVHGEGLPSVPLGAGEPYRTGDPVIIIGNPLGIPGIAVRGTVAGNVRVSGVEALEILAPIQPGSSGSPVFNEQGQVMSVIFGIINDEDDGEQKMARGVAIPVEDIMRFIEGLGLYDPVEDW